MKGTLESLRAPTTRLSTSYDGRQFVYRASLPLEPTDWFARYEPIAPNDLTAAHMTVSYNGNSFEVLDSREIFDPETRNMLEFNRSVLDTP